jgi:hypothetical protein
MESEAITQLPETEAECRKPRPDWYPPTLTYIDIKQTMFEVGSLTDGHTGSL